MMGKAWKTYERWVAEQFNARRNPLSGKNNAGRAGDVIHELVHIEAKNHKNPTINNWLRKASEETSKPTLVFVHKKNRPYERSSVTLPWEDFKEILDCYLEYVKGGKNG